MGELGSGAGKGGGGGGAIREAGGSFGKMEAAREEEFFYKQVHFSHLYTYELVFFKFYSYIKAKRTAEESKDKNGYQSTSCG